VREEDRIVIRAPGLEYIDREALQHKLGGAPRVGRRQITLPIDEQKDWKDMLDRILAEIAVLH